MDLYDDPKDISPAELQAIALLYIARALNSIDDTLATIVSGNAQLRVAGTEVYVHKVEDEA